MSELGITDFTFVNISGEVNKTQICGSSYHLLIMKP